MSTADSRTESLASEPRPRSARTPVLVTVLRVLGVVALVMAIVVMAGTIYLAVVVRMVAEDAMEALADFEVPAFDSPAEPTLDGLAPEDIPQECRTVDAPDYCDAYGL